MAVSGFDAHRPPTRELLDDCVHCGFCLPACPTYRLWGEEADSPRGRILLMDQVARGTLPLDRATIAHWDACLGCMACMPACPSGVQYDRLIERTRQQAERQAPRTPAQRALRATLFGVLPHRRRVRALGLLAVAWNRGGAGALVRRTGLLRRLPRLLALDAVMPRLRLRDLRGGAPSLTFPAAGATPRRRVALLEGCVAGAWFGRVNAAAARVLAACGAEVVVPDDQGCCGALEVHSGREAPAAARARRLIDALERGGADVVAVTAAGCGSTMKDYGDLLGDDPAWRERAQRFGARVRDITEVLAELGPPPGLNALPLRVAYHDACHLAHAQGVREAPRTILGWIPGLSVVEVPDGDLCCGSAGVYNLLQPGPAAELGRRKAAAVHSTGAQAMAAANPGCLVQIGGWLHATGAPLPSLHPVELLDLSLRGVGIARALEEARR